MSAIGKFWERIRPHVEFRFIEFALPVIGSGLALVGAWAVSYWMRLTPGLTPAQRHELLWVNFLIVGIAVALLITIYLMVLIWRKRSNARPQKRRTAAELHFDIQDVRFYREQANNLYYPEGMSRVYVLLKVLAVNRSEVQRAPQHWTLGVRVGAFAATAEMASIDYDLSIERRVGPLSGVGVVEPLPRPTWDELTETGLSTGVPRVAWAAFSLLLRGWFGAAPCNAEFTLTVTDSMGAVHSVVREPQMYFEDAMIVKNDASRAPAGGTS